MTDKKGAPPFGGAGSNASHINLPRGRSALYVAVDRMKNR